MVVPSFPTGPVFSGWMLVVRFFPPDLGFFPLGFELPVPVLMQFSQVYFRLRYVCTVISLLIVIQQSMLWTEGGYAAVNLPRQRLGQPRPRGPALRRTGAWQPAYRYFLLSF